MYCFLWKEPIKLSLLYCLKKLGGYQAWKELLTSGDVCKHGLRLDVKQLINNWS